MKPSIKYDRSKFNFTVEEKEKKIMAGNDGASIMKITLIYLLPSSVIIRTVELGPSPSGLKTCIETRYCVNVSRFVISWLCMVRVEKNNKKRGK